MQARAFNPQIFLESLCHFVFGSLMLYLINTGAYLSYVTPRMKPYLYFTAIIMLIWACTGFFRVFRPQHRVRWAHCFVLVLPALLLLLPHSPLSTSELSGSYISGNTLSTQSGQSTYDLSQNQSSSDISYFTGTTGIPAEDASPSSIEATDNPSAESTQTDVPEDESSTDLPGLDTANRKITVSNDDFGLWYTELYANMEKYEGYTVVITGFVYKDPELLQADEFVPARLMMSCCVADLAPAGFLCKYENASELKADSWITVEGTLIIGQYEYNGQKYDDPQITVTKITPAEEVEGYVYPYY